MGPFFDRVTEQRKDLPQRTQRARRVHIEDRRKPAPWKAQGAAPGYQQECLGAEPGEASEQIPPNKKRVSGDGECEGEIFGEFAQIAHRCRDWNELGAFELVKKVVEPVT